LDALRALENGRQLLAEALRLLIGQLDARQPGDVLDFLA
jgi:hypothetical protein